MKVEDVKKYLASLKEDLTHIKTHRENRIDKNNRVIAKIEADNQDHHGEITEAAQLLEHISKIA